MADQKVDIQEIFDEREKKELKELLESEEYKNASEMQQIEFRLSRKLRNILRLD